MQVETFECVETASEPIEASEEAIGLIESLGLAGQKELICKPEEKPSTRCPYREMTAEEAFVYGVLCPDKSPLGKYKASPIPLRVLQIAAHANSLGIFKDLEVWDRESVTVKDPVLVAYNGDRYKWDRKLFILARWGEELETFATLLKRAVAIKREQFTEALEGIRASIDAQIASFQGRSQADIVKAGPEAAINLQNPFN